MQIYQDVIESIARMIVWDLSPGSLSMAIIQGERDIRKLTLMCHPMAHRVLPDTVQYFHDNTHGIFTEVDFNDQNAMWNARDYLINNDLDFIWVGYCYGERSIDASVERRMPFVKPFRQDTYFNNLTGRLLR
jgi:hypothetical protein